MSNPTYGPSSSIQRLETRSGTIDRKAKLVAGDEYQGQAIIQDTYLDIAGTKPAEDQTYSIPMEAVPNRHYDIVDEVPV